jgi:ArsR family transcriptional regulator
MKLIALYKCLSEETRLRILKLLHEGALCGCHIQAILGQTQVQTSKALATMKRLGVVQSARVGTWMIYEQINPSDPILRQNLKSLDEVTEAYPFFQLDLKKRRKILENFYGSEGVCPPNVREVLKSCCS